MLEGSSHEHLAIERLEDFTQTLKDRLVDFHPSNDWKIKTSMCIDLCSRKRLSFRLKLEFEGTDKQIVFTAEPSFSGAIQAGSKAFQKLKN